MRTLVVGVVGFFTKTVVLVQLSQRDSHIASMMGADTVALCKMQGFSPRLENGAQTREEANAFGYKAEFAVARLFNCEPPVLNVLSDGGVDLWFENISVDVKFTNKEYGSLIFDNLEKFRAQIAILVGRTDDPDVMRVNGWMSKKDFAARCHVKNFGYGDRLIVDWNNLNSIESLWKKMSELKFAPKRKANR